jgi:hypothetical protein
MQLRRWLVLQSVIYSAATLLLVPGGVAQDDAMQRPNVALRVRVEKAKYCRQPAGFLTLRLTTIVEYHNEGSIPVILPRITTVNAVLLSLSEADALRRNYYSILRRKPPSLPDRLPQRDRPAPNLFDILAPGASAGRSHDVVFAVYVQGRGRQTTDLLGRDVYVQLEIEQWPFSASQGRQLTKSWRPYGVLLTGKVRTAPLSAHVERSPSIADCSGEYRM